MYQSGSKHKSSSLHHKLTSKEWDGDADEGHQDNVDGSVQEASDEAVGNTPLHQLVLNHVVHRHGVYLKMTATQQLAGHTPHALPGMKGDAWAKLKDGAKDQNQLRQQPDYPMTG